VAATLSDFMIGEYFQDCEVRDEFQKEFISIFNGWLGKENLHKLNEVQESDWKKFNVFIELLATCFEVMLVNPERTSAHPIKNIADIQTTLSQALAKEATQFTTLIIPSLNCIVSEDWDFTFIIWYKNKATINAIAPLVKKAGLYHFSN
jgi:hypothetical protein